MQALGDIQLRRGARRRRGRVGGGVVPLLLGGGARGNAGGAVGVGWASESRAAAWWRAARHALMAPWGLVGCLSSYPGLTHAIALLGVVVVAPLVLSAVVLAALSYFV